MWKESRKKILTVIWKKESKRKEEKGKERMRSRVRGGTQERRVQKRGGDGCWEVFELTAEILSTKTYISNQRLSGRATGTEWLSAALGRPDNSTTLSFKTLLIHCQSMNKGDLSARTAHGETGLKFNELWFHAKTWRSPCMFCFHVWVNMSDDLCQDDWRTVFVYAARVHSVSMFFLKWTHDLTVKR